MPQVNNAYHIIKGIADNAELENYRQCFIKNGTDRNIENLQWLHQQNLAETNTIFYAMDGNSVAAIYTALPVMFIIDGQSIPALQSIDTMTDVDHRGKGLFIKLASALYDDATEKKFALVYGFPNENSASGFFKKLKWNSFGEAPFLIKPINLSYFFKKFFNRKKQTDFSSSNHIFNAPASVLIKAAVEIKRIDRFDVSYDALWQAASESIKVGINRNASYMNWRFVDKPDEHYYRYGLYENNSLQAVVVFAIKKKHDGKIGYIMELVFKPGDNKKGKMLLIFAGRMFKSQDTDAVLAWCFDHSFNFSSYRSAGYYKLPLKLRPQKLFLGVRAFDDSKKSLIENPQNWYISYSDSDTV